ncbi:MAG: intracellular sulfur oxidation DsrE/DsrF family protein [Gammaproteobacteria bacterium]|jgi:intracellular sulfur oxidation DsrE/DsrF family protein
MAPRLSLYPLLVSLATVGIMTTVKAGESVAVPKVAPPGYVFDVTVSSVQELTVVLDRADSLRSLFDPQQHGRISIVLHGNELQLFQKGNYLANQSIVDRARLLDRDNIIDIKACQTMMRTLNIQQSELPSFIEQVPYAPAEIFRLKNDYEFTEITPGITKF